MIIMQDINEIINIYNKINIPVLRGSALREDLFLKDIIFKFIRTVYLNEHPKDFFPDKRTSIPNKFSSFTKHDVGNWKKTKKKLNQFLKSTKQFLILGKENSTLVSKIACSYLIEALYCLERAIFWFFNYKYNVTKTFEAAGIQALYYSNFFIKVAIQKFLGISVIHTKYIGKILVKIDWSNANVEILTKGGWSADHKKMSNNFFELMKNVDIKNFPEIYNLFRFEDDPLEKITGIPAEDLSRSHSDYLRKARMEYVYDFTTRESDPFNSFYGTVGNYFSDVQIYCFLDGTNRYNDGSEYFGTHIEPYIYGGWGINEHFIGSLMKFLIDNLKKIKNLKRYFSILSHKIENPEEFDELAKDIILSWLSF